MLNFDFLEKGLGLVSPPLFVYHFLGKVFLMLCSIIAKQLYWNLTSAWVFSCKFAAYFQNTFS